jgi:hypothetical protein
MEQQLKDSRAAFKFGPTEGPGFFEPYGWKARDVRSSLKTVARLHTLSPLLRQMAALPASNGAQGWRPWSGVCLLEKMLQGNS